MVPHQVKVERRQRLLEIEAGTSRTYQQQLLGRRLEVLVEGADPHRPGHVTGTSCRYVPLSFRGHLPALLRKIVPVMAVTIDDGVILGEPVPDTMPRMERFALPLIGS